MVYMSNVIVLIADLESSRELDDSRRTEIQRQLSSILEQLNRDTPSLLSPHTITLGDEFQAVYSSAHGLFNVAWEILDKLYPINVRFSWTAGSLNTPINRNQALGMDGPAFHRARANIETMKKEAGLFMVASEVDDAAIKLANGSLQLISDQLRSWNQNRFSILARLARGQKVSDIADELDLSEVAVYKNRKAGSLPVILDLAQHIETIMNERLEL